MASYRLIQQILDELQYEKAKEHNFALNTEDFIFSCNLFSDPAQTRAELDELERCGYIKYIHPDHFVPIYRAFHWKREKVLSALHYIGRSFLTPIFVTLATIWVTSRL
ncbi:MAG: hypothetical protein ACI3W5_09860 [Faecousia sp.]